MRLAFVSQMLVGTQHLVDQIGETVDGVLQAINAGTHLPLEVLRKMVLLGLTRENGKMSKLDWIEIGMLVPKMEPQWVMRNITH